MHLDRDEFLVTYDSQQADTADLIAIIRQAGYTARIATDSSADVESDEAPDGSPPADDAVYVEALARAQRENKPVVIDFMASWCVPCQRMEQETFTDPDVARLLDRVVFLKVDTDEHPELARQFHVEGLPDIRFLASDGTPVRTLRDFQDAAGFTESLRELISGSPAQSD